MNWLVFHVASGQGFFSGVALVILAAFTSTRTLPAAKRVTSLAFCLGTIAIVISSTAIPYWCYGLAVAATLAWFASAYVVRWRGWTAAGLAAAWLVAGLFEFPYHWPPRLSPAPNNQLTIVGDSVTAGLGTDKPATWPTMLADEHALVVQDISHVGDTVALATQRVKAQPIKASMVIVEVGGNDLLGSTTSAQFDQDLNELLAQLATPGRQVIMFELPLPPFCHEFGRVQRAAAKRHHVQLIPKRVLLSVLAGDGDTLDSVHLSPAGHRRMANTVWQLVKPAFSSAALR